ncbi:penicillin acylase family protein [Luethyella okanaganae]|uniref:Penicillin acylase family protein n=1 Tax=Luethyella okanaganae TaxID=69372 RepID=A0ABW1VG97_9MICO
MSEPARVDLFRDSLGVPHLRAEDELRLVEAQGRITAIDRGWQIEVDRWRAEGRLAEHLGRVGTEWDRFARRIRLADTAKRAYDALEPADRGWVDAYVHGVNDGLELGRRVPEFQALASLAGSNPVPTPWPGWAPLGVFLVAHVLFSTFPHLLWRAHVARALGDEHVDRFAPESAAAAAGAGSNAWALHGSRTTSGSPLLAGDPHRLIELPGVYQQVRLACDDFDVVGLALPGVPGIPHFGHAGDAAWGITNALAHSAEVFQERLRTGDGGIEALGPEGWEPTSTWIESIRVRGAADETVRVVETERGPVVVDGPGGCFSLRLPARVEADLGFAALRRLLRVRSAADVASAFLGWVDPVNRVLAADRAGEVLRFTAGRVADRERAKRRMPLPAWSTAATRWRELPPPEVVRSMAVDANERPDRPDHDLGFAYAHPSRADRIRMLLSERPDMAAPDMLRIHADTFDARAGGLLARLDEAIGDGSYCSDAAAALATRLRRWDRGMDAGSRDAAMFSAWRSALVRRLAAHPALTALYAPHGMGSIFDPWFSVPGRVGDVLESLLDAADLGIDGPVELVGALEDVAGAASDPAISWGDIHRLHTLHALDDVPGADAPTVTAVPLGGDSDCVRCTASVPGVADVAFRGSVARWVWDLADRRSSRWNVPFGASGDPGSAHFDDQLGAWAKARTVRVETDWAQLERKEWPCAG